MIRSALAIFAILLLLCGCADARETKHDGQPPVVGERTEEGGPAVREDKPEVQDSTIDDSGTDTNPEAVPDAAADETPDATLEESPDVSAALNEVRKFLDALKAHDAEQLARLLEYTAQFHAMRIDEDMAKTIIEGFAANFDLNFLVAEPNEEGLSWSPESGRFEFTLRDNGDMNRFDPYENALLIGFEENGTGVYYYSPYIRYFPYAGDMVSRYMELIEAGEAEKLAGFLNPDDLEVPVRVAEETISNYKAFLKGGTPTVRYVNRFFFAVDNGRGEEHTIRVMYGDGLMSIRDEFIPEF